MTTPDQSVPSIDAALLSDVPLSDPSRDDLKRTKFAKWVAHVLSKRQNSNSLVVGIYGKWGAGKTTVLNFIQNDLEPNEGIIVINFNPWRFANEGELLLSFFDDLARALGARVPPKQQKKIGRAITKYGQAAASGVGLAGSFLPNKFLSSIVKLFTDILKRIIKTVGNTVSDLDFEAQKKRIELLIGESKKRVVVFMDDIDRLDNSEIQAVFRLVKLVADFKYVSYVLAFDPDIVADSLAERYGEKNRKAGYEFLEKIVQVSLNLPRANYDDLLKICLNGINEATRLVEVDFPLENYQLRSLFAAGFSPHLTTPRLAKRYGNSLTFTLPLLAGEINTIDFILMEGIRLFYPSIFADIRNNSELYLVTSSTANIGQNPVDYRALRAKALEDIPDDARAGIEGLIEYLFPRTRANMMLEASAHRDQRIFVPSYFERYFAYAILDGDISDKSIIAFAGAIGELTQEQVTKELKRLLEIGGSSTILRKLDFQADKLSAQESMSLIRSLISLGNEYPLTDRAETTSFAAISALDLIERLIAKLTVADQELVIREIVRSGEPLHFVAAFLAWSAGGDGRVLAIRANRPFAAEMFGVLAQRISTLAQVTSFAKLIQSPFSRNLLDCWVTGSSRDEVESFLVEQFQADSDSLRMFLVRMAPKWTTIGQSGMQNSYVGDLDDRNYSELSKLLDPSVLQQEIVRVYGDSVKDTQFVSFRDSDLPDEVRLAQQFSFLFRAAEERKQDTLQKAVDVTSSDLLDAVGQEDIDES